MEQAQSVKNPMARVMGVHDFRLLFVGATTSLLGDQFALIATPWLVLQLTGDPLILGIVLALEGVPRAVFMLVGGAISDRFSPRVIMIISDIIRFVLTALMALVVFTGAVQVWMLYAFGLGFGLVAGFAIPAENSLVPMLVEKEDLTAGNSIMMGVSQLVGFIGPTVAGILIGGYAHSLTGVGLAFAIDAFSFAVSAACLWLIRAARRTAAAIAAHESIWASIVSGIRYMWSDRPLRLLFLVMVAVNFFLNGPLLVGIPVLANQRLPEGAFAFGLLMSGYAGGNLGGYLIAGSLRRPTGVGFRIVLLALLFGFGLVVGALGFIRWTWLDFGLLLLMGLANGYMGITIFTWMQLRTPQEMLGRMMSLVMLAGSGLVPVSEAISGALSKWDVTLLFAAAGVLVLLTTIWIAFQPDFKTFSEHLATGAPMGASNESPVQAE